jgi:hypothetical protein
MVWQVMQRLERNTSCPFCCSIWVGAAAPAILPIAPCLEGVFGVGEDYHAHMSMLQPAKFGALATIGIGLVDGEPDLVFAARNRILLAHQRLHPEAVDRALERWLGLSEQVSGLR